MHINTVRRWDEEGLLKAYRVGFQQEGSKLRGTVRQESGQGEGMAFELIAPTTLRYRSTRHEDTSYTDTIHSRRWAYKVDPYWADLIDKPDRLNILIEPGNPYAKNASMSMGRAIDTEIITAITRDAKTGVAGAGTTTFAADWPVTRSSTQGDLSFVSAALTTPNILNVMTALDDRKVPRGNRHIVVPPEAINQLLAASTAPIAASSDYNTIKALVQGEINTWCGFQWHIVDPDLLPTATGDTTRPYCFAYHGDAMGLWIPQEPTVRVDELPGKHYSTQVYCSAQFGAVRIQGEGVVRFAIDTDN